MSKHYRSVYHSFSAVRYFKSLHPQSSSVIQTLEDRLCCVDKWILLLRPACSAKMSEKLPPRQGDSPTTLKSFPGPVIVLELSMTEPS